MFGCPVFDFLSFDEFWSQGEQMIKDDNDEEVDLFAEWETLPQNIQDLIEKLNNKQIEILKKTEKSKIKTTQEKAMLTRTLNNVHKILNKLY